MKIEIIVVFCVFLGDAYSQALSENKTLFDQLIGKMSPDTKSLSGSTVLDSQLTRFLVAVITKNPYSGKWVAECYGALINKKSFLSTKKCLSLSNQALVTSRSPAEGFMKEYTYTIGDPMSPYLNWAVFDGEVDPWPIIIPLRLITKYDYENKPAERVTMNDSGQPALMSLNVGIMNDEIISIPKTRFDKNDVPFQGELLFFDSLFAGLLFGRDSEDKHYLYQVVKNIPEC